LGTGGPPLVRFPLVKADVTDHRPAAARGRRASPGDVCPRGGGGAAYPKATSSAIARSPPSKTPTTHSRPLSERPHSPLSPRRKSGPIFQRQCRHRTSRDAALMVEDRQYFVYILASRRHGTLYIGVTNDLLRRTREHCEGLAPGFTRRYGVKRLVYYETYQDVGDAIHREKV